MRQKRLYKAYSEGIKIRHIKVCLKGGYNEGNNDNKI